MIQKILCYFSGHSFNKVQSRLGEPFVAICFRCRKLISVHDKEWED